MSSAEWFDLPEDQSPIGQWDAEISQITGALRDAARDRDDAAPDSAMYIMRQTEADSFNYRKAAFQRARPVLVELYERRATLHDRNDRYRRGASENAATYTRVAATSGMLGGIFLLAGLKAAWAPWWVGLLGVVLLLAAVIAVVTAVTARQARLDTSGLSLIAARISAIERACSDCWDRPGLERVSGLLDPPREQASREVVQRSR